MKGKNASAFFCVGKCWVVPKECGAQPLSLALALSPRGLCPKSRFCGSFVIGFML
jgi:hypothetical protein